ncbi:MAG: chemotaxis protein CheR [candidate division Zixibacteria bacterium]|nr:chemotaxis protein CheR [candidate division Zixibacteria bacterium]
MKDAEGVEFLQWSLPKLGLVWPGYRKVRRQVYKRIQRRLESLSLSAVADYQRYLETHREEWTVLDSLCWISISRFYRDKAVFEFLEQEVLPSLARQILAQGESVLRCWSIGCAGGEEPYSLSLLWKLKLQAQFQTVRLVILATDVDEQAVARAQRGCYPPNSLSDLPESWRGQGFEHTDQGSSIKTEFREPVTFLVQDIREAVPTETFHLILCRYLPFTYFDASLQDKTLRCLVGKMRRGDALVIGKNERLPDGEFGLILWSEKEGVYRRA